MLPPFIMKIQNILETPLERRCQRGTGYMNIKNSI